MKGKLIILSTAIVALASGITASALKANNIYTPDITLEAENANKINLPAQEDPFLGFSELDDNGKLESIKALVEKGINRNILIYEEKYNTYFYENFFAEIKNEDAASFKTDEMTYLAGTSTVYTIHNNDKLYYGKNVKSTNLGSNDDTHEYLNIEFEPFSIGYVSDKKFNIGSYIINTLGNFRYLLNNSNVTITLKDNIYEINCNYDTIYTDGLSYISNSRLGKVYFGSHVDTDIINSCLNDTKTFYKLKYSGDNNLDFKYDLADELLKEKLSEGYENPLTQANLTSSRVIIFDNRIVIELKFNDITVISSVDIPYEAYTFKYDKNNPKVQELKINSEDIDLLLIITEVNNLKITGTINPNNDNLNGAIALNAELSRVNNKPFTSKNVGAKLDINNVAYDRLGTIYNGNGIKGDSLVECYLFRGEIEVEVEC